MALRTKMLETEMSLPVFENTKVSGLRLLIILNNRNVIAYCFPSHTSGRLQPLDVSAIGHFKLNGKNDLKESINYVSDPLFR